MSDGKARKEREAALHAFPSLVNGGMTDEFVPPKLHELFKYLEKIAQPNLVRGELLRHAVLLHVAALHLSANVGSRSYKIGRNPLGGFYSKSQKSKGPAYDLSRLNRAGITGSTKRWLGAWAATNDITRSKITCKTVPLRLDPNAWVSFSSPGFVITAPRANVALPAVVAAKKSMQEISSSKRKVREGNPRILEFIAKLREAYTAISGSRATLTYDPILQKDKGPFVDLIRQVETIYAASIMRGTTSSSVRKLKTASKVIIFPT